MLYKNIGMLSAILLLLSLSSCARVPIKNTEWCGDMGPNGAQCFHTLSDESRTLSATEWENERFGMICATSKDFGEFKKVITNLCRISKRCTYEMKQKINTFFTRVDEYEKKIGIYEENKLSNSTLQR